MLRLASIRRVCAFFRDNLVALGSGFLFGLMLLWVAARSGKWIFVLSCGLLLGFVSILAGSRWKQLLLFLMIILASMNIDINFFVFDDHVGGANGLRISGLFVILILLYMPWIYAVVGGRGRIRTIRWITIPLALYLLIALLSSLNAIEPLLGLYQAVQLFQAYLIFLYLSNRLRSEKDFALVLFAMTVALGMQGAMTIAQRYTALPLNFRFFGGAEATMMRMVAGAETPSPSGFFVHPGLLANFVVMTLPLSLGALMFLRSWLLRLGVVAAALAGSLALVLTLSRGAWIAMVAAFVMLTVFLFYERIIARTRIAWLWGLGLLAMSVVLVVYGKDIYLRFTQGSDSIEVRYELAYAGIAVLKDYPLLGVGLNNFTNVVQHYDRLTVFLPQFHHPVHNIYLLELCETGVPGGLFFILLLFGICKIGFTAIRQSSRRLRYVAAAAISVHAGFLVIGVADWSYRLPEMNTIFWMNAGILGALFFVSCAESANANASGLLNNY